jgi:acyl carrier protein
MIPTAFVVLSALPLLPNGKVDRTSLPRLEHARRELAEEYTPPTTSLEAILAQLYEAVLGVERVGVHDNFFDLGGHSLRATRLMSRISEAFQIDLPLRVLFESPTVAGLAQVITAQERSSGESERVARMASYVGRLSGSQLREALEQISNLPSKTEL